MPLLNTYHVLEREEGYYFVSSEFNAVFRLDREREKIQFLEQIPNEMAWERNLISKIVQYKDKMIFVPLNAKCIWIKNIKSGNWNSIDLRKGETAKLKFFQAIQCGHKIYMIGCCYPSIVCLDMDRESVAYFDGIMGRLDADGDRMEEVYFRNQYVQIGSYVYMASCKSNSVLKFNMENEEFDLMKVGNSEWRYSGIAWDGRRLWLSLRYGGLVAVWNPGDDGNCFSVFDFHIGDEKNPINGIICDNRQIYLFTHQSTFCVDLKNLNEITKTDESYWTYNSANQTVWISQSGVLKICEGNKEKFCASLEINNDDMKSIFKAQGLPCETYNIRSERRTFDLMAYLWMVESVGCKKAEAEKKKAGTKIWSHVTEKLLI